MKIAVECKSPLLQKSLELFLQKYLCSVKNCDIVVCDEKKSNESRSFYISRDKEADLTKPFSKSQLILALEKRFKSLQSISHVQKLIYEENSERLDFEILEKRIEDLTRQYQQNILDTVRAFYEK